MDKASSSIPLAKIRQIINEANLGNRKIYDGNRKLIKEEKVEPQKYILADGSTLYVKPGSSYRVTWLSWATKPTFLICQERGFRKRKYVELYHP